MTIGDYMFGVFVAMPLAALSLAIIGAVYATPVALIVAWVRGHRGN